MLLLFSKDCSKLTKYESGVVSCLWNEEASPLRGPKGHYYSGCIPLIVPKLC